MSARTSVLIVFVVAAFVLATLSHGYAAQMTSNQQRTYQQNQSGNNPDSKNDLSGPQNAQRGMANEADSQAETPRGNLQQPVVVRHVGWSWLLLSGLFGYFLGRITSFPRRPYGRDEDSQRNRAA